MNIKQTYIFLNKQKRNLLIPLTILLLVISTIITDFLFAQFHNYSFFVSESLLFSTYWFLFLPLLTIQWRLAKQRPKKSLELLIIAISSSLHLLGYPALVWILSKCFSDHTFQYWQTFNYGLTAYTIITVIIYTLSLLINTIYKNNIPTHKLAVEETEAPVHRFITSIIVSERNNKKIAITTKEILFFSASSPYVGIHLPSKNYLQKETLKSLETQLDKNQFVRIHKSYIVNICNVVSYRSRLNGDYDLKLTNDTLLRVSRNYAAVFKKKVKEYHRLEVK